MRRWGLKQDAAGFCPTQPRKTSPVKMIAALSTNHRALSVWGPIISPPVTSQMTSQVNVKVFIAGASTCRCSLINYILLAALLVTKQREQQHLDMNQLKVKK